MDVHKDSISIAVRNTIGKIVMKCLIETKSSMILQFFDGLRGDLHVTFEEETWAAWPYDFAVSVRTIHTIKREIGFTRARRQLRFDPQHIHD
jgi:hypothetical protein